ncbi:putative sucrose utilization protein SUC1 [Cytospora mali]|uniref:Sucrose utilization protein SUC1 n=1 Tax=Cytospora mali TaxID=578113 RepID=A0A194VT81_CYTMA|nr:putative sucrose utilization protein SUC1 [Valsa mali]
MKTEDDASDFISSLPPAPSESTSAAAAAADAESGVVDPDAHHLTGSSNPAIRGPSGSPTKSHTPRRTVCDHCRRRRIRCDGKYPCQQCINATLTCKRDHVPRKRGPKRGHGRVINELRAREIKERESRDNSAEPELTPTRASYPSTTLPQDVSWQSNATDPRHAPEPASMFTSDQHQPLHRPFLHLIPQCVDLYYEHIYPIMPVLYMPTIRSIIARQMSPSEKNLIYAVCAMVCMHMSGKSLHLDGPASWEDAGRFFLDECVSNRRSYDFMEDASLYAVVSSFWLSTSFFEINQNRKSWLYLREALTLAQDMGLHDDSTYINLSPEEALCRQRVFWILFVTERSFAILRNKPITFKKTPSLPTTRHTYESPDIHTGFLQLVSSYTPLDESFVSAWNDGSDPRVSATTYLALQNLLAQPPSFLQRSRATTPSDDSSPGFTSTVTAAPSPAGSIEEADEEIVQSEPTAIQKADLLITQQWLRLIVWQASFRQSLLSWTAPHEGMHFAFPLAIARSTARVLQSLPSSAVEVHGMGIFEKIFEIGTWCMNVLGAIDRASAAGTPISGLGSLRGGVMGMDFLPGSVDLGVLGVSRKGAAIDPLEFFVRTLSATPNSRTQYAERLLMFAQERPGGMRMALTPSLTSPVLGPEGSMSWSDASNGSMQLGSVFGEVVKEENDQSAGTGMYPMDGGLNNETSTAFLGDPMLDPNNIDAFSAAISNAQTEQTSITNPMPSLTTSAPLSNWAGEMGGQQDWDYDLTSPVVDSFSNQASAYNSAYNSGTGTPVTTFPPGALPRQESGDSIYQYRQLQQQQFGNGFNGGGSSSSIGMTND